MTNPNRLINYCLLFTLILGLFMISGSNASAQTTMTLAVTPQYTELDLVAGETVTVDLYMTNAVEANAFDITLTYDPALVQLKSWAHGGAFSNLSELVVVNVPGTLQVAATQLARPAVSGGGSVLKLAFSGTATGTSALTITQAVFPDKQGAKIYPETLAGSLTVFPQRSTLTGMITLQGQSIFDGIPVALSPGQTLAYGPYSTNTTADSPSNLDFGLVVDDIYNFTTAQPRYLNVHEGLGVSLTLNTDRTLSDLNLCGGNAVWTDNRIDISDASVVGAWYELSLAIHGPDEGSHPDVNFDGIVNIQDLAMVAGNYGLSSESAYAGWTP